MATIKQIADLTNVSSGTVDRVINNRGRVKPEIEEKIREVSAQGIPVVTSNTDIPESGRLAYTGSNYYQCGKVAANLLALSQTDM